MKKYLFLALSLFFSMQSYSIDDVASIDTTFSISEVTVTSLYRNNVNVGYLIPSTKLISENYGQEPSNLFRSMPSIYSMNDNGTEFGYGYFRIRGLDQTRINVTLDGMPWNEAEDYGTYFANSPDIMSSLHSIKVERGSSASNNGTASSGGSINLESVNLLTDTLKYAYIGAGSFNTYKTSIVYNSGLIGKSAFHIKATQQQTDGFRDNSENNSQAFTIKYGYFFNDGNSLELMSFNGRHRNGQGWIGSTKEELTVNKHNNGNTEYDKDEWFQTVNNIQYKSIFNDKLTFTSSVYLQYQNGWYNMDLDNYIRKFEDPEYKGDNVVYSYGLRHYLYGGNATLKYYKDCLSLAGGVNYYRYQREHFLDDRLSSHFKNIDKSEFYDNTGYKNDFNIFLSASYSIGKFNFNGNIQYRYVDFSYRDHLEDYKISANDLGTDWNFLNYGISLEYKLSQYSKLYGRYSEVSREPTRSDMFGGLEWYSGEITTNKAERSHDIEVGYEANTDKVKANVNLYYMKFSNERVLNGEYGLNGLPLHDTADKSYRTGIEATLAWNFVGNFFYELNSSLSRNKISSDIYKDKSHILTPSFTFNNEFYYNGGYWKVGINNLYRSKIYVDQENLYKIPEHLTFNAYGNIKLKNIELGARINNIFNRTNYYNAAEGLTSLMWFRDCGTSFFADIKLYF